MLWPQIYLQPASLWFFIRHAPAEWCSLVRRPSPSQRSRLHAGALRCKESPRARAGRLGSLEGVGRGSFEGEKEICTKTLSVICPAMCSPIEQHSERGGTDEAAPPAPEPRRPQRQPRAAQAVVPPAPAAGCCVDCAGGHCPPAPPPGSTGAPHLFPTTHRFRPPLTLGGHRSAASARPVADRAFVPGGMKKQSKVARDLSEHLHTKKRETLK